MKVHLLITPEIEPVPDDVKVLHDFGKISVIVEYPELISIVGNNAVVEASEESIIRWLGKYDEFWKGSGVPQMEHFELANIPKKLVDELEN